MPWRLPLAQPIYTIFGANTGVGKTIISTLLVKSLAPNVSYIKPVSTGPLSDADYLHVDKFTGVVGKVLYQFDEPCSPHLAAGPEPPHDSVILQKLAEELQNRTNHPTLVESAGGVHSPAPSGSSQLELYRPLRLPVILVADSNLGGISTTISSYESLRLHGFDVAAIIGFKASWGNMPYLASKLSDVPAIQIPPPPARLADAQEDAENMSVYYDLVAQSAALQALRKHLIDTHEARIARLEEMPTKALETFWYPFTQHSHLSPKTITTIDSAHEDDFAAYSSSDKSLRAVFDASASWWTQGLGHGNSELAIEAAYAGSRYGHVILPNAVNEPALGLAESLLQIAGKDWASRVYYSDNGATGIEVALKMALKASRVRYANDKEFLKLGIVGLTGSYHGDTIGAMDASDPNVYNDEVDWYQARGLFFDPPSLLMQQGKWVLSIPEQAGVKEETSFTFETLGEIFAMDGRLDSPVAAIYTKWITSRLQGAIDAGQKLGALIFEPILLGAGGMVFVDPLFQRLLVDLVRSSAELCPPAGTDEVDAWTGLPVITDEVFTGLYRLSVPNAYDLLGIKPDISVNAKLLTGGAVPLATTMASEAIFRTFYRAEKKDALLHGHSYTAHPTGTSVARKSLRMLQDLHADDAPGAVAHRHDWAAERSDLFSVWQHDFVRRLSHHARLDGVLCLGSVLSLRLRTEGGGGGGGYSSMAAANVVERMRNRDGNLFGGSGGGGRSDGIMARPLGNVIYFMASQVTTRETADRVQTILQTVLDSSF